jgi:hypothetical protein
MTPRDREKLRVGWEVASNGGTKSDLARTLGVSAPAVSRFLRAHPELSAALKDGRKARVLPDNERSERILMCAQAELGLIRWCDVARAFGISRSGIVYWSKANAVDIHPVMDAMSEQERRAA